jgi:hypothetical protein
VNQRAERPPRSQLLETLAQPSHRTALLPFLRKPPSAAHGANRAAVDLGLASTAGDTPPSANAGTAIPTKSVNRRIGLAIRRLPLIRRLRLTVAGAVLPTLPRFSLRRTKLPDRGADRVNGPARRLNMWAGRSLEAAAGNQKHRNLSKACGAQIPQLGP